MREEVALLRTSVERMCAQIAPAHLDDVDDHPDTDVPRAVLSALEELGLESIDTATEDGRRLLSAGLDALAERSAALATLVLVRAGARALAGEAAPEGHGAFPIYADLPECTPRPTVEARGDGVCIEGHLEMVAGAPVADWLLVPLDGHGATPSRLAISAARAGGVHRGPPLLTLGMRGCPTSDVVFHGIEVQASSVIAFREEVMARFRGPVCAITAALARSSFETAFAYAQERVQGGRPIVEHGEVRRMLADAQSAASLCAQAVRALCADPADVGLLIRAREAAAQATSDGVQVLGGYGYMEDYGQERRMRDARQACMLLGRGEVLRQRMLPPAATAMEPG